MIIRRTVISDLPDLRRIYAHARVQMALGGNQTQWGTNRPLESSIACDINDGNSYVVETEGRVCAVFSLIIGIEPTYSDIEDGNWPNSLPYGTIHRIASDGTVKGIFDICLDFCFTKVSTIRIDTHEDNRPMLHLIGKHGFERCGIIHVDNGTPRIAFQKSKFRRIYLIGYMGSGKSTAGKRLASKIGFTYNDTDLMFERKYKISVDDFFRKYDEGLFRRLESEILRSTSFLTDCVVATGGGTPCFADNMDWMNANGLTVFIKVSPQTAVNRLLVSKRKRPLIEGKGENELAEYVSGHYAGRLPFYEQAMVSVKGENIDLDNLIKIIQNA